MEVITSITAWLASPIGKSIALYVAGIALRLWPQFFNKAIPAGTAVVNLALTLVNLLAQAVAGPPAGVHTAALELAQPTNVVLDIILPQIIADGAYNWPRKFWRWFTEHGKKLFH